MYDNGQGTAQSRNQRLARFRRGQGLSVARTTRVGEYASLEDLASTNGVDRTYVGRILRLTSLSPEIVKRILDGDEPEGLSLAKLRKHLPLVWADQKWD